jgi:hypothetical protein
MPSGRYAFLWRQPFADCRLLEDWVKKGALKARTAPQAALLPPVVPVCELEFQG